MSAPNPAGPTAPPVCPRHPDRVSYVRCQRCERPVCVDCQRPAAVGVHCVDCVREAARTAPVPRSVVGAPLHRGRPVVTLTVIALSVVSYLLQWVVGSSWTEALLFVPRWAEAEPWRFVTAGFLHATSGFFLGTHLLLNMYALWNLGRDLEGVLGRWRYVAVYLLSVVGGHLMFAAIAGPQAMNAVLGASGGIFGLLGAVLVLVRRVQGSLRPVLGSVALIAVLGFVLPGIAWQAHLGGLLVGGVLGAAFVYAPRDRRQLVAWAAPAAMALLLLGLGVVLYR